MCTHHNWVFLIQGFITCRSVSIHRHISAGHCVFLIALKFFFRNLVVNPLQPHHFTLENLVFHIKPGNLIYWNTNTSPSNSAVRQGSAAPWHNPLSAPQGLRGSGPGPCVWEQAPTSIPVGPRDYWSHPKATCFEVSALRLKLTWVNLSAQVGTRPGWPVPVSEEVGAPPQQQPALHTLPEGNPRQDSFNKCLSTSPMGQALF